MKTQPRTDAELQAYARVVSAAMASLDALPQHVRLLIHEFGVPAVQVAVGSLGMNHPHLRAALLRMQDQKQAERLAS